MYKVISFTRVSSQQQNLESQNKEVHDAIIRHGYSEDEILYVQQKESAISYQWKNVSHYSRCST